MNTAICGKFTLKNRIIRREIPLDFKNESSIIMADREQNTLSKYVIIYIYDNLFKVIQEDEYYERKCKITDCRWRTDVVQLHC